MYHIIFIQMLSEGRLFSYVQLFKHRCRITTFAVICRQHIGCYGLTEAAWSAVTNKGIIRIYDIVGDVKKISFINVYF